MNIKTITLDNGLKLVLNQDKSKHRTMAVILVKVGGLINEYYLEDELHNMPYGVAHFLEHYLLEQSIYGNCSDIFDREYIKHNGITSNYMTEYYISTVHDFEDNFIKLLNVVNNPIFETDRVEKVKKPIIAEINRKNDNKRVNLYSFISKNIFKNEMFNKNLGEIETIQNMNVDYLKDLFNIFYQPSNQIIFLTGNFDDNIVNLIEDTYKSFKREYPIFKVKEKDESNEVVNNEAIYNSDINESFFNLTYKVNISSFTPIEKNKFNYYLAYILETNFREESELFDYMIKNKLSLYEVTPNYNPNIKNFGLISFVSYTEYFDEVLKLIQDRFNDLILDEEQFKNWKNRQIIQNINKSEKNMWKTDNFINNVMLYDLYSYDDVDFIKNLNLDECKSLLNRLDFSNYTVVKNIYKGGN